MAQQVKNLTSVSENAGSSPGPAQWVNGSGVAVSCSVGHRLGSDPTWLWGKPVAVAQAGSCSPNLTPSLGTSICCRSSLKKSPPKKKFIKATFGGDLIT